MKCWTNTIYNKTCQFCHDLYYNLIYIIFGEIEPVENRLAGRSVFSGE